MNILRFYEYINESVSVSEYKSIIFDVLSDLGYKKRMRYVTVETKEFGNKISLFLNRELLITTWRLDRLILKTIDNLKRKIEEVITENPGKFRL